MKITIIPVCAASTFAMLAMIQENTYWLYASFIMSMAIIITGYFEMKFGNHHGESGGGRRNHGSDDDDKGNFKLKAKKEYHPLLLEQLK